MKVMILMFGLFYNYSVNASQENEADLNLHTQAMQNILDCTVCIGEHLKFLSSQLNNPFTFVPQNTTNSSNQFLENFQFFDNNCQPLYANLWEKLSNYDLKINPIFPVIRMEIMSNPLYLFKIFYRPIEEDLKLIDEDMGDLDPEAHFNLISAINQFKNYVMEFGEKWAYPENIAV
jgi:hypothetical protein